MRWAALAIVAILQAQFPVTGKAGCVNGKELSETLCTYACGVEGDSRDVEKSQCLL